MSGYKIKRIRHNDDLKRIRRISKLFSNTINLLNEIGRVSDTIEAARAEAISHGAIPKNIRVSKNTFKTRILAPFKRLSGEVKAGRVDAIGKAVLHNLFRELQMYTLLCIKSVNEVDKIFSAVGIKSMLDGVIAKLTKINSSLDTNRNKLFIEIAAKSSDRPFNATGTNNGIEVEMPSGKYGSKYPTSSKPDVFDIDKSDYKIHDSLYRKRHRDDLFDEGSKLLDNLKLIAISLKQRDFRGAVSNAAATNFLIKLASLKANVYFQNKIKELLSASVFANNPDKTRIKQILKEIMNSIIDTNKAKERLGKIIDAAKSLAAKTKDSVLNANLLDKLKDSFVLLKELLKKLFEKRKECEGMLVKYNPSNAY